MDNFEMKVSGTVGQGNYSGGNNHKIFTVTAKNCRMKEEHTMLSKEQACPQAKQSKVEVEARRSQIQRKRG
jgi:hypothetical protein